VLEECVDFEALRKSDCPVKVFLSAPTCAAARSRYRAQRDLRRPHLASACLPFLFQAVEIDGEHYWDGGYMGNPALFR